MAAKNNKLILLFLLILPIFFSAFAAAASAKQFDTQAYVESSCRTTLYPSLCVRSLSRYVRDHTMQSPQDLARVALKVSLYRAKYTKAYLLDLAKTLEALNAKDYPAVRDCLTQIKDSVNQLSQAILELNRTELERTDRHLGWHISNVQTWTSTALTDANTCVNEFQGRRMSKLKATIKGKVKNVEETTSNALAFIERYAAARFRARTKAKAKSRS